MKLLGIIAAGVLAAACGGKKKPDTTPLGTGPDTTQTDTQPAVSDTKPPDTKPAPPVAKSLFDRLGGQPSITAVVEEFVANTTKDPRIKERFFNTDAANLKKQLVDFVCMATGGPCKYGGRDMPTVHAGMEL